MRPLDARTIAKAMEGEVTGPYSVNVPGPGHSRSDRSLSIQLNPSAPGGFVVYSHSGDNPIECRDYVRDRLGLEPWGPNSKRAGKIPFAATDAGPDFKKERNKAFALRLWAQSVDPRGTIVERYLREHRCLELEPALAGRVIRFHGSLFYNLQTRYPGMVCLLRNIETDEPSGIHRTFLDRKTAAKIDRKMFGVAKGSAIKLDPTPSDAMLTIGEGVESAMSARQFGYRPAWALGSSASVGNFPVLKKPAELTILEEDDPTSRRDVRICTKRYLAAGKPVNIVGSNVGSDLNDAWRGAR